MSAQFTPGPWQIDGFDRIYHGEIIKPANGNMTPIAVLNDFNRTDRDEEREANAMLIVNAPELLAAIQELGERQHFNANHKCEFMECETFGCRRVIELIVKATGQAVTP